MGVLDGAGRESPILHLPVKVLYVSWREHFELNSPQSRDYVAPCLALVRGVRAGPNASSNRSLKPLLQTHLDRQASSVENEPAIPVRYRLYELLTRFFSG